VRSNPARAFKGRYFFVENGLQDLPDGVRGQPVHVDFDVGPDALVRQELAGDDLGPILRSICNFDIFSNSERLKF
jgi:hypothetical protein